MIKQIRMDLKTFLEAEKKCNMFRHKWVIGEDGNYHYCERCTIEVMRPPCECELEDWAD